MKVKNRTRLPTVTTHGLHCIEVPATVCKTRNRNRVVRSGKEEIELMLFPQFTQFAEEHIRIEKATRSPSISNFSQKV